MFNIKCILIIKLLLSQGSRSGPPTKGSSSVDSLPEYDVGDGRKIKFSRRVREDYICEICICNILLGFIVSLNIFGIICFWHIQTQCHSRRSVVY